MLIFPMRLDDAISIANGATSGRPRETSAVKLANQALSDAYRRRIVTTFVMDVMFIR